MTKNRLFITLIGILSISLAHPCQIGITNDSATEILVVDMNDQKAVKIQRGKTKRIGDPLKHANCQVFTKKPRAHSFDLRFTLKQNQCAGDNKPMLKLSDLEKENETTRLFTINDYQKQQITTQVVSVPAPAPVATPKTPTNNNHGCSSCKKH